MGASENRGGGAPKLTKLDVERLFEGGYRDIEILPDGTLRETVRFGGTADDNVTKTLKTERTWYCGLRIAPIDL